MKECIYLSTQRISISFNRDLRKRILSNQEEATRAIQLIHDNNILKLSRVGGDKFLVCSRKPEQENSSESSVDCEI